MSENFISITGRVAKDPELRFTNGGMAICNFRVAHKQRKKRGDQWVEGETMFLGATCFGGQAEIMAVIPIGTLVRLNGKLGFRTWEAQDGRRQEWEVIAETVDIVTGAVLIEGQKGDLRLTWGGEAPQRPGTKVAEQYANEEPF
ncbi:MAG: single-stranded DNA-binding protein [Candidatus Neomicrothrix subdominans]